jgi:hypothetical protein
MRLYYKMWNLYSPRDHVRYWRLVEGKADIGDWIFNKRKCIASVVNIMNLKITKFMDLVHPPEL